MKGYLPILLLLFSCTTVSLVPEQNIVSESGIIKVYGKRYKEGVSSTKIFIVFYNISKDFLYIPYTDIRCKKNELYVDREIPLDARFIKTQIELFKQGVLINPDESRDLLIICKDQKELEIEIKNIYSTQSTIGPNLKLIRVASNLKWKPEK